MLSFFTAVELQTNSSWIAKKFVAHDTVQEQASYKNGVFSYINVRDNTKKCHFSWDKIAAREQQNEVLNYCIV